ncbi:Thiosulfate sulfurtransferase 18 [Linum perenne]
MASSGAEQVPTIDVHKAKSLIESDHVYLDVRMQDDFCAAHAHADMVWQQRGQLVASEDLITEADDVPKIYNVPYYVNTNQGRVKNPEFLEEVRKIFKEDDHLVVGMKNACNLGGGYRAWEQNGFPVIMQQKQPETSPEL